MMQCECGQHSGKEVPKFPWRCSCGTVWESLTKISVFPPPPCKWLRNPTGETIECAVCGGDGIAIIYKCEVHVETTLRKPKPKTGPPWEGMNCLECKAKGLDYGGNDH